MKKANKPKRPPLPPYQPLIPIPEALMEEACLVEENDAPHIKPVELMDAGENELEFDPQLSVIYPQPPPTATPITLTEVPGPMPSPPVPIPTPTPTPQRIPPPDNNLRPPSLAGLDREAQKRVIE
ncbi:hypothetical protein PV327_010927 [Microctonus hyperodae]|uniref:Uncharacterized protein n=1 Tax=Microctonus hyperodae TaxID=165561 RepID=A0AA39C8J5_MICHY|nr:hypothetical protein PV327_010927 [Microctonus hyperodae]